MNILDELLAGLPKEPVPIRRVLAGVHWSAVCSRNCGLAVTLTNGGHHDEQSWIRVRNVGEVHHMSAQELAQWVHSKKTQEVSLGMAAINSLLPVDERQAVVINAGDILTEKGAGRNVVVVGHFPFTAALRSVACNCWVLEQQPQAGDLPAEAAPEVIPQADVVAITGMALVNGTLDGLLALCPPGALVMVLGPSTPLTPLWFEHGVTVYSGTRVIDEELALRTIEQGAGFRQVQGVRLLSFWREDELGSETTSIE